MIGATRRIATVLVAVAALSFPAHAAQDVLVRHVLSGRMATDLAQRAVEICGQRGFEVSASIADAAGEIRTTISSDGVSALSVETARRKAHAAAIVGFPTSKLVEATKAAPAYAAMLSAVHPEFVFLAGALPIRIDGAVVGAIGIGGGPNGEQDESCATEAVAQIADRLK